MGPTMVWYHVGALSLYIKAQVLSSPAPEKWCLGSSRARKIDLQALRTLVFTHYVFFLYVDLVGWGLRHVGMWAVGQGPRALQTYINGLPVGGGDTQRYVGYLVLGSTTQPNHEEDKNLFSKKSFLLSWLLQTIWAGPTVGFNRQKRNEIISVAVLSCKKLNNTLTTSLSSRLY